MRKGLLGIALSGLAFLTLGQAARADTLLIGLQEAGVNLGNITVVGSGADFTSAQFTGTYGDFAVTIAAATSDNGALSSDLMASTTSVQNKNTTSAETLTIYVLQANYTQPVFSPLSIESGMGGSITQGTLGMTGMFQAYADSGNGQDFTLFNTGDFTNGLQSGTQNGSSFDTGSAFGSFSHVGNYALMSAVTLDLSSGAKINFANHVVASVPLPSSALGMLALLPVGYLARRKAMLQNPLA